MIGCSDEITCSKQAKDSLNSLFSFKVLETATIGLADPADVDNGGNPNPPPTNNNNGTNTGTGTGTNTNPPNQGQNFDVGATRRRQLSNTFKVS